MTYALNLLRIGRHTRDVFNNLAIYNGHFHVQTQPVYKLKSQYTQHIVLTNGVQEG